MNHLLSFLLISCLALTVHSQYYTCNPTCVQPAMCDTNTGTCRTFRTAFNGPVSIGCSNCPTGTSCDTNTGVCRTFRISN